MAYALDKSEALKGITTEAGRKMAAKKFQLDKSKADVDNDGELTKNEEMKAEAVQKAEADNPEQDDKGLNCGGMMEPDMDYDPVSGNPIPPGSSAENVRDDIQAWLSEGEYVLPADVVKWHGLKHIMEMQDEAKMGLMTMTEMGLIVEAEDEEHEEHETEEEEASEEEVETEETPEGNEIEFPEYETVEEAIIEGEEDLAEEDEEYGKDEEEEPSMFGMVKKPKISFII